MIATSCSFGYPLDSQWTSPGPSRGRPRQLLNFFSGTSVAAAQVKSLLPPRRRYLPRRLSGYKNLDVFGAYATVENIKEDDFREKPASFENKVRDIVAPVYRDQ